MVTRAELTADILAALESAASAHHEYEQALGQSDPNWAEWYADYMAQWFLATGYEIIDRVPQTGG